MAEFTELLALVVALSQVELPAAELKLLKINTGIVPFRDISKQPLWRDCAHELVGSRLLALE